MNNKLALPTLILMVIIPVALAGILGQRWLRDSGEHSQTQYRQLLLEQLAASEQDLQQRLDSIAAELQSLPLLSANATGAQREQLRKQALLGQLAILDKDGNWVYPSASALSASETAFMARTANLRKDGRLHQQTRARRTEDGKADQQRSAWLSYYAEDQLWPLYYIRREGQTFIYELNPARFKAELISALPDSAQQIGQQSLHDHRGEIVYLWGNLKDDTQATLTIEHPLASPLSGWRLQYQAAALSQTNSASLLWLSLGLLTLLLSVLALLLHNSQRRALRLAEQQVSFVNQVSHELKTPLTNIQLYADLAAARLPDDAQSRDYLKVVEQECQRLGRLINNVLGFSRQLRQSQTLHPETVSPGELISDIIMQHQPMLEAAGIEVQGDFKATTAMSLDRDLISQVLGNLLSNVEKYAASAGRVQISSASRDCLLEISVRDFGPGIKPGEEQKIFEAFYRSNNSLTEGVSGSGIGLSLARDLCRAHGGDLTVRKHPDGAAFTASFSEISEVKA